MHGHARTRPGPSRGTGPPRNVRQGPAHPGAAGKRGAGGQGESGAAVSAVNFRAPSGGHAQLAGFERTWLGDLCAHTAFGIVTARDPGDWTQTAVLTGTAVPDDFEGFVKWAGIIEFRLSRGQYRPPGRDIPVLDGNGLTVASLMLSGAGTAVPALTVNTVMAAGSDPLRLAARIASQAEDQCLVEGPDRAWLAGVISAGLDAGVLRRQALTYDGFTPTGWAGITGLLLARDDEPVVVSSPAAGGFPEREPGWGPVSGPSRPPAGYWHRLGGDEHALGRWHALPAEEKWQAALDGLRGRGPDGRLDPARWGSWRAGHGLSVLDLADDSGGRAGGALSAG
jgi:hypothetical protein